MFYDNKKLFLNECVRLGEFWISIILRISIRSTLEARSSTQSEHHTANMYMYIFLLIIYICNHVSVIEKK